MAVAKFFCTRILSTKMRKRAKSERWKMSSCDFLERYLEEHLMESLAMEANYAGCGEKLEHMI